MTNKRGKLSPESALFSSRAFSLVELMIVVVLIGLLAGISVATLGGTEDSRIAQLNRDLSNRVQEARSHAMRSGEAVLMEVTVANGDAGNVVFSTSDDGTGDPAGACGLVADIGEELTRIDVEEYGVQVVLDDVDPDGEDFYCIGPNGRVVGDDGSVLGVSDYGCTDADEVDQMNLILVLQNRERANEVDANLDSIGDCEVDSEISANRDLVDFSMIHIGYGGQTRIIR